MSENCCFGSLGVWIRSPLCFRTDFDVFPEPSRSKKEVEVTLRENDIGTLGEEQLHLVKLAVSHLTLLFPRLEDIQLDVLLFNP